MKKSSIIKAQYYINRIERLLSSANEREQHCCKCGYDWEKRKGRRKPKTCPRCKCIEYDSPPTGQGRRVDLIKDKILVSCSGVFKSTCVECPEYLPHHPHKTSGGLFCTSRHCCDIEKRWVKCTEIKEEEENGLDTIR